MFDVLSAPADGSLSLNLWLPKTYNEKIVKRMNINFFRFPWCCGLFMFEWDRRSHSARNQSPLGRASILYFVPFCTRRSLFRPSSSSWLLWISIFTVGLVFLHFFFFSSTYVYSVHASKIIYLFLMIRQLWEPSPHYTTCTFNTLIYYHFISQ